MGEGRGSKERGNLKEAGWLEVGGERKMWGKGEAGREGFWGRGGRNAGDAPHKSRWKGILAMEILLRS